MLRTAAVAGSGSSAAGVPPSNSTARFDVSVEFKIGQEALLKQKYAEASRAFGRVLQVIPRDANTNLLAGMAKAGLGKTKDARRHFEKAVKYDPDLILAHQELALAQAKTGKTEDAEEVLAQLCARAAKCADTRAQAADLKSAIPLVEAALKSPETSQVPAAGNDFLLADSAQGDRAYLEAVTVSHAAVARRASGARWRVVQQLSSQRTRQSRFPVSRFVRRTRYGGCHQCVDKFASR